MEHPERQKSFRDKEKSREPPCSSEGQLKIGNVESESVDMKIMNAGGVTLDEDGNDLLAVSFLGPLFYTFYDILLTLFWTFFWDMQVLPWRRSCDLLAVRANSGHWGIFYGCHCLAPTFQNNKENIQIKSTVYSLPKLK